MFDTNEAAQSVYYNPLEPSIEDEQDEMVEVRTEEDGEVRKIVIKKRRR